ncbi:MAG TPA: FliA/WhiG family RNA polymerase sigma factor [Longimicrobiales bacterium]|nr:FliA/WhiG family RNA polymerase sigma factor [Longimicrobiales bacterium]
MANICFTDQAQSDLSVREELLKKNLPLVHHVARQLARTGRMDVEFDDLVSAGTIGLINAVDHFDAGRGLAFGTFAAPRIRGAILDDLRRRDHVPRSVRRKQRELARARESFMNRMDRQPSDGELAEELGVEVERVWQWRREAEYAARLSLDHPVDRASGSSATLEELLAADGEGSDAEAGLNHREEVEHLREEILNLKDQERLVISLYYFEELKLHEIAAVLGVTESRVSQIRSKALANLRARMGGLREGLCA